MSPRLASEYGLVLAPPDALTKRSTGLTDIRDECLRRIERLAEELDATDELIRLVAQRAACPAIATEIEREIDRRLWELDEVDAAMHQLSA